MTKLIRLGQVAICNWPDCNRQIYAKSFKELKKLIWSHGWCLNTHVEPNACLCPEHKNCSPYEYDKAVSDFLSSL